MKRAAVVAVLAGCTAVYNAQYDDRKAALEQSRQLVLPGADRVQFISAGDNRMFWLDNEQVTENTAFHSIDTASGSQLDYGFLAGASVDARASLALGDQLVVECGDGRAFDATSPSSTPIATADFNDSHCFVSGTDVYFVQIAASAQIVKWHPDAAAGSNQPITTVVDLTALHINTDQIGGMGLADATHILFQEGTNAWLIDTSAHTATLLNTLANAVTNGFIAFDAEGVVFPAAQNAPLYTRYSDATHPVPVSALIANGGYDLSVEHGDVQDLADGASYTTASAHLIYQASGGIFALGFDTGNVVDLLLDGRPDEYGERAPQYGPPTVTANGQLFVQDINTLGSGDHGAVYRVDLSGRLR